MSISTPESRSIRPPKGRLCNGGIPPLENGDHLTRDDFMQRYEAMSDLKKAELIEGVVFVPSPVRHLHHGKPHSSLVGWLFVYGSATPGLELSDNSTVLLDMNSAAQPDCVLFIQSACGGKVVIDDAGYITGAPDLVAEVAASSASYDLHAKLAAYERSGVREYIVWRVIDGVIDWFTLRDGRYEKLSPEPDGTVHSTAFPGLWLDPAAMVRGDLATVQSVVQRGVSSPEQTAFVIRLHAAGEKSPG